MLFYLSSEIVSLFISNLFFYTFYLTSSIFYLFHPFFYSYSTLFLFPTYFLFYLYYYFSSYFFCFLKTIFAFLFVFWDVSLLFLYTLLFYFSLSLRFRRSSSVLTVLIVSIPPLSWFLFLPWFLTYFCDLYHRITGFCSAPWTVLVFLTSFGEFRGSLGSFNFPLPNGFGPIFLDRVLGTNFFSRAWFRGHGVPVWYSSGFWMGPSEIF